MLRRRSSSRTRYAQYRANAKATRNYNAEPIDASGKRPEKRKLQRSFASLFAAFVNLLRGHMVVMCLALMTQTVAVCLGLLMPTSTKVTIDFILTDEPGPTGLPAWLGAPTDRVSLLWMLGGVMLSVVAFNQIISMWARWQVTRLTKRLQAKVRRKAFEHAVKLPLHRVQALKTGGMVSVLRDDAGQAAELLFSMIYNPSKAVVQLIGTLFILAWVDYRMLLGALMLIPATWVTHRTWIARIRPVYRDIRATRTAVDGHTTESFGGMRVVRGFGRARRESARFTTANHVMARQEILAWWWSRILEAVWGILIPVASVSVMIYGGSQVIKGNLTIGDLMMFSTYLLMLLGPLETLTSTAANIQSNLAGFDRILDLLDEPEEFADSPGSVQVSRASARGRVELRDVWFTYPVSDTKLSGEVGAPPTTASDPISSAKFGFGKRAAKRAVQPSKPAEPDKPREPAIRGVSLLAEAGETIALVGSSGSGKTTLCNLVARFYDATQGEILFDGIPLKDIQVASFRRLLGIVEQEVFLFDGSIAANIAYGSSDATMVQIREAARAADADQFIEALEQGYDTLIGERGVRLSGGQKQRIAIARALLADPVILILDEATSNLDSESEAMIQRSLAKLMKGRTSFVIAHRLSTIRNADRIVVMDRGRVVEIGSHEQLLRDGGRYAELLRAQIDGFSDQLDADNAESAGGRRD
jgi:ATP-binding cassette, subfamily B, bacterial